MASDKPSDDLNRPIKRELCHAPRPASSTAVTVPRISATEPATRTDIGPGPGTGTGTALIKARLAYSSISLQHFTPGLALARLLYKIQIQISVARRTAVSTCRAAECECPYHTHYPLPIGVPAQAKPRPTPARCPTQRTARSPQNTRNTTAAAHGANRQSISSPY